MKMPKLKYYYLALGPQDYEKFVESRRIECSSRTSMDITTGKLLPGQTFVLLYPGSDLAHRRYRQLQRDYDHTVYVLRIPRALVPGQLTPVAEDPDQAWICRHSLQIDHCGVESWAVELAPAQAQVIAQSKKSPN